MMKSILALAVGSAVSLQVAQPPPAVVWVKERGTADGNTRVYRLSKAPHDPAELAVFLNGLYQSETNDYTLTGNTVAFWHPPAKGDALRFWYLGVR